MKRWLCSVVAAGSVCLLGWGSPALAGSWEDAGSDGRGGGWDRDDADDPDDDRLYEDHDGRTIQVDDDRRQCPKAKFSSIQAAVLAAPPGSHIHVCPGLYPEDVTVPKPLTLHGAGPAPEKRTIDPNKEAVVQPQVFGFSITADKVDVGGFTVAGNGGTTGILVNAPSTGITLRRNYLASHDDGIEYELGAPPRKPSSIRGNRIELCNQGVSVDNTGPTAPDPDDAKLSVRRNQVHDVDVGIAVRRSRGVLIASNELLDFRAGITVARSTGIQIAKNRLESGGFSDVGISLRNDQKNAVLSNTVTGRFRGPAIAGIHLDGSRKDLVVGNVTTRNSGDGILLDGATANTVMFNRSDDNGQDGIDLHASQDNALFMNTMHGNFVFDASDDNRPLNEWVHNSCDKDFPPGTICSR